MDVALDVAWHAQVAAFHFESPFEASLSGFASLCRCFSYLVGFLTVQAVILIVFTLAVSYCIRLQPNLCHVCTAS